MVLVYDKPLGGKVMIKENFHHFSNENDMMEKFFKPLIACLTELNNFLLTCRAIRPDNLFFLDAAKTKIVIGDFLATNPAAEQPIFVENIESALCNPIGRGEGRISDDIYSFAVTALALEIGYIPDFWTKNEEILENKILEGSYTALCAKLEIQPFLMDFLKGCLADDAEHRWNLNSLAIWLTGKKVPFIGNAKIKKASRPYLFNGKTYFSPRSLAKAFVNNWDLAKTDIYSDAFLLWLTRAFGEDSKISEDFLTLKKESVSKNNALQKDLLLAETCMLLDEKAPVRYHTLSFMPDAMGALLADAYINNKDITPFYDLLSYAIPGNWKGLMPENNEFSIATYSVLSSEVKSTFWGSGLERCLYMLAHNCPCLSKILDRYYVENIETLLPSLNEIAKNINTKTRPIDLHIAAFIACKVPGISHKTFEAMSKEQEYIFLEAMILLYAIIQKQYGPQNLYGLASWIGGLISPIIESYHNYNIRKRIEADIPKVIRKGNLIELSIYLNDFQLRKEDKDGFTSAIKEYIYNVRELEELEQKRPELKKYSIFLGQQLAAIISVSAALIVAFSLLVYSLF